jgi:hypothetical protein
VRKALIAIMLLVSLVFPASASEVDRASPTSQQIASQIDNLNVLADMPLNEENICNDQILASWVRDTLTNASKLSPDIPSTQIPKSFNPDGWKLFQDYLKTDRASGSPQFPQILQFGGASGNGGSEKGKIRSWMVRFSKPRMGQPPWPADEEHIVWVSRASKVDTPDGLVITGFSTHSRREVQPLPVRLDQAGCPVVEEPSGALYRGLAGVNFYLEVDGLEALRCHGREDECAYRYHQLDLCTKKRLIDNYDAWPKQLLPDNLTKVLVDKIEKNLMPYIKPDAQCKRPPVNVLKFRTEDGKSGLSAVNNPDTLTISVHLSFDNQPGNSADQNAKPKAAILAWRMYRPNFMPSYHDFEGREKVIPLELTDAELNDRFKYAIRSFAATPMKFEATP